MPNFNFPSATDIERNTFLCENWAFFVVYFPIYLTGFFLDFRRTSLTKSVTIRGEGCFGQQQKNGGQNGSKLV